MIERAPQNILKHRVQLASLPRCVWLPALVAGLLALTACADKAATDVGEHAFDQTIQDGDLTIRTHADKDALTVADRVHLEFTITAPEQFAVELPERPESMGDFTIAQWTFTQRQIGAGGESTQTIHARLEPFLPGESVIPSLEVVAVNPAGERIVLTTPAIPVTIRSVLAADDAVEITGLKEVAAAPPRPAWLLVLWIVVGVVVIAAVVLFIVHFRKARVAEEEQLSPAERALRRLQALLDRNLAGRREFRSFYNELSELLRIYIEDRFGVRAPEQTTEEFLRDMNARDVLTSNELTTLREYLRHCDLVKFAAMEPSPAQVDESVGTTQRFIEKTATPRAHELIEDEVTPTLEGVAA